MVKFEKIMISNSYNFFQIQDDRVLFWGMDILFKTVKLNSNIEDTARKLKIPNSEVIEIFDDETLKFF